MVHFFVTAETLRLLRRFWSGDMDAMLGAMVRRGAIAVVILQLPFWFMGARSVYRFSARCYRVTAYVCRFVGGLVLPEKKELPAPGGEKRKEDTESSAKTAEEETEKDSLDELESA